MGAAESAFSGSSPSLADQITTISQRSETVDPILEKLKSLKFTSPILTTPPTEGSLTDILVRKPSSSSAQVAVNPKVLLELFSMYHDWQEEKAQKFSKKQEEIENKIEVADALAVKLLQSFNYSVSIMKTSSQHLSEVHTLQVELGELKGRLTEVFSNCDALCKRIAAEGPEPLRSSIKPFAVAPANSTVNRSLSSVQRVTLTDQGSTSTETKSDLTLFSSHPYMIDIFFYPLTLKFFIEIDVYLVPDTNSVLTFGRAKF